MLDRIKDLFKEGLEYTHTAGLLQQIANVVNIVNAQYMKDHKGKNAALDAICELLQSHKDKPVSVLTDIKTEMTQGKPQKQAVAIALETARRSGAKIPKKGKK